MWKLIKPRSATLRLWQLGLLALLFLFWHVMTKPPDPDLHVRERPPGGLFFGEPARILCASDCSSPTPTSIGTCG